MTQRAYWPLHLVCGENAPSQTMKKRLVGPAMQALEGERRKYTDGAPQPANAVMVLCGECNLTEELGKQAAVSAQPVQETPTYLNYWIVKSSRFAESGDVLF